MSLPGCARTGVWNRYPDACLRREGGEWVSHETILGSVRRTVRRSCPVLPAEDSVDTGEQQTELGRRNSACTFFE